MKLTPLDIHHKEFTHSLRGYNEAEVDEFLDQVADELERLFKENIDLNEKLEATEERVKSYQDMERTLHNTQLAHPGWGRATRSPGNGGCRRRLLVPVGPFGPRL